ncbi:MAG: DUF4372 domain-containing protein [Burkholderiales bacterium]
MPSSFLRRFEVTYRGKQEVRGFSCLAQFLAKAFAESICRESLRDIVVNLRIQATRLYYLGYGCATISRNALANANAARPSQICADLAQHHIGMGRPHDAKETLGDQLDTTVYAFNAAAIDSCLPAYPRIPSRSTKTPIKRHTLPDLRGAIRRAFYLPDHGYADPPGCFPFIRRKPSLSPAPSCLCCAVERACSRCSRLQPGLPGTAAPCADQGRNGPAYRIRDQKPCAQARTDSRFCRQR